MFKEAHENGKKLIFGLIHTRPFPGSPFYKEGNLEYTLDKVIRDAKALENGGADGCLVQTNDSIYPNTDDCDYVRVATLAMLANEVKHVVGKDFKVGVQIMWNCITPSIAVARAIGADFTRCTCLVGRTESTYGLIEGNPLKVLEYRRKIGAENVEMIAEISGYHNLTGLDEHGLVAKLNDAARVRAEAVEVCDRNEEINNKICQIVRNARPDMPIILGGGTTVESAVRRLENADGALVGACFEGGQANWGGYVQEKIVAEYMAEVRRVYG